MGSKIGYPSKILNLTQLDLDYHEVYTAFLIIICYEEQFGCQFAHIHLFL